MTNCQINVQFILLLFSFLVLLNVVLGEIKLDLKDIKDSNTINNKAVLGSTDEAKPINGLKISRKIVKRDIDFEAIEEEISGDVAKKEKSYPPKVDVSKRFYNHRNTKTRSGPKVWDHWGKWTTCSVSCGVGKMTRWRHCVSGGCASGEKEAQIKTCTLPAC